MRHTQTLKVWSVAMDGDMFDVRLVEDLDDPNRQKVHFRYPRAVNSNGCPFRMGSTWEYTVEESGEIRVREATP